MRRLGGVLVSLVLAVGATGCGAATETTSQTGQPTQRGYTRVVSVPWNLVGTGGSLVRVHWVGGGCLGPDRTRVVQDSHSVTISILAKLYVPGPGEACTSEAVSYVVRVHLNRPVGQRKVLHGSVSPGALF